MNVLKTIAFRGDEDDPDRVFAEVLLMFNAFIHGDKCVKGCGSLPEKFSIPRPFPTLPRNRCDLKICVKIADQPPVQVFIK